MMTKTPTFVHTLSGIPLPKYEHGDFVWYEINFDTTSIAYFGKVEERLLNNGAPGKYYWEYLVSSEKIIRGGELLDFHDEDFALETDLQRWQR